MTTRQEAIEGFIPFQNPDDPLASSTGGDTPGTNALRAVCEELEGTCAEEVVMAMPGETPRTSDCYPHSQDCEARLCEAARLIRLAVEYLHLAKKGQ